MSSTGAAHLLPHSLTHSLAYFLILTSRDTPTQTARVRTVPPVEDVAHGTVYVSCSVRAGWERNGDVGDASTKDQEGETEGSQDESLLGYTRRVPFPCLLPLLLVTRH